MGSLKFPSASSLHLLLVKLFGGAAEAVQVQALFPALRHTNCTPLFQIQRSARMPTYPSFETDNAEQAPLLTRVKGQAHLPRVGRALTLSLSGPECVMEIRNPSFANRSFDLSRLTATVTLSTELGRLESDDRCSVRCE